MSEYQKQRQKGQKSSERKAANLQTSLLKPADGRHFVRLTNNCSLTQLKVILTSSYVPMKHVLLCS